MFSLKRLVALLKRDLMINRYSIVGYVAIMAGIVAGILIFRNIGMPNNTTIIDVFGTFHILFYVGCVVMACSLPFKSYEKKYNRSEMILLPASVEEKFVVNFISAFIIVPIIQFCSIFIGMEIGHFVNWVRFDKYTLLYDDTLRDFTKYYNWLLMYVSMGISFFGALFFQKNKLIKTWAIVFAIMITCFIGFAIFFVNNLDNEYASIAAFFGETVLKIIIKIAMHIVFIICCVGTYFQLRKARS